MVYSKPRTFLLFIVVLILSGCAGSASHEVVTANQAGDDEMTCQAIDAEIVKTQVIIDGVNQDKEDISGADVVDGILWFPFNLIAKHENYNDALEAADRRLEKLNKLKESNNCLTTDKEIRTRSDETLKQLKELSAMHKQGTLTDDEYKQAKSKLIENL
jgi:uncharacterized protein YceK